MLLSWFHVLLPSTLSMEGWRTLGFCLLSVLGTLLTIFNIDMVYGGFSLIFQKGESSLFMLEVYVLNTVPVITYLDVISDKDKILNENRGKSGIYRWTNVNSKKSYVGSSSDLARRLQCYLSTNYMLSYKSKSKIYSSLLKHWLDTTLLHWTLESIVQKKSLLLESSIILIN